MIDDNDVEVLEVEFKGAAVNSVHKLPGNAINSHSINCGYSESNLDGEAVEASAKAMHLSLVHNAKLPKSFNSGR